MSVKYKGKKYKVFISKDFSGDKVRSLRDLSYYTKELKELGELEGLEGLTDVKVLSLAPMGTKKKISKIEDIEGLEALTDLQVLDLTLNRISEIKGLTNLTNLEALILSNNNISEIKGLDELEKLRILYLMSNNISEIKDLGNLTNLKTLIMSKNKITEIKGLEKLINLETLILGSNDISEINGLENLENLRTLNLGNNKITEIKGLENLANLETLVLKRNDISEINGLENLENLRTLNLIENRITDISGIASSKNLTALYIHSNPVYKFVRDKFIKSGLLSASIKNPKKVQSIVNYYWKKKYAKKEAEEYIEKICSVYSSISFKELQLKTKLESSDLKVICEDMIYNGKIKAQIEGDIIVFKTKTSPINSIAVNESKSSKTTEKGLFNEIEVLRGGQWKIEGKQSVFTYKIKVKNASEHVITNIQFILASIPKGLNVQTDRYKIDILNPHSFEAPAFKLYARDSCVGDVIKALVVYTNSKGNSKSIDVQPLEIKYVCNLLVPKEITKAEFEKKTILMEDQKSVTFCSGDLEDVEKKLTTILQKNNFYILPKNQNFQGLDYSKIEGFAQGRYDKKEVALEIMLQQLDKNTQLIIKTLSDEKSKLTDILKDISVQCDDIKSDTELLKEYTSQINDLFDKIGKLDDIEIYLKEHLASDWESIKETWDDYKTGKINRNKLVKEAIKILGKTFIKKIIEKVI